jgi:hypothetical protein
MNIKKLLPAVLLIITVCGTAFCHSRVPPANSEMPITQYQVHYGFGNPTNNSEDARIIIYIYDNRKHSDGTFYKNELFILDDRLFPKLPEAYQYNNGIIRFFAHESQLDAILRILDGTACSGSKPEAA